MYATRIVHLFLVTLGVLAVVHALEMDKPVAHQHVANLARQAAIQKRQANSGGDATGAADPTSPSTPDPTDEPTSDPPTPKPTDEPTTPSTTNKPPTSTPPTSKPEESTPPPDDTTSDEEPTATPVTETKTTIITTTNANGQVETRTGVETSTRTPGLSESNENKGSGMSTGTRNTVIGVVVGVGGAIVLGALAFVAWRIWGRKRGAREDDGLSGGYGGATTAPYAPMDKSEAGSSAGVGAQRNPFQSTLETYHAPTQVNASSNF